MPLSKLTRYLDKNRIGYMTIDHPYAITAQEVAEKTHIPGREVAKTVVVRVDGELVMAVLPATGVVDLDVMKRVLGAGYVELAAEDEFERLFPGCETGAMPPFGNLFGLRVMVDRHLTEDDQIAFNAGSHSEVIMMPYRDFERLVRPSVLSFQHTAMA